MNENNRVWWILFLVGGGALLVRAATTEFGKSYARDQTVYVTVEGGTAEVDAVPGLPTAESDAAHPDAARWTRSLAADPGERDDPHVRFSWADTIGLWCAALLTLAIFSFLFGDNPGYRLAEAIFVGVSAGYAMIAGFWEGIVQLLLAKLIPVATKEHFLPGLEPDPRWADDWARYQSGDLGYVAAEWAATTLLSLVPLVFGVMLLMRLSPKGGWISRWPLAFFIGATAGLRLIVHFESDFIRQIQATLLPLIVFKEDNSFDLAQTLANVTIVVGVLSSLVYFFFSKEHEGVFGGVSRLGIWFLMITFGASFGYTVMGRITLFAQRLEFLFDDWLWIIDPLQRRAGL